MLSTVVFLIILLNVIKGEHLFETKFGISIKNLKSADSKCLEQLNFIESKNSLDLESSWVNESELMKRFK